MADAETTWYLEMNSRDDFVPKPMKHPDCEIRECQIKCFQVNRFLYQYVGQPWQWTDKLAWSDQQWKDYGENDNLRLWIAYYRGSPAGYFELKKQNGDVEIAYFGLAQGFIGKGLGAGLLTAAINEAWNWQAGRVCVNTCSLDHPHALNNYQARGFRIFQEQ